MLIVISSQFSNFVIQISLGKMSKTRVKHKPTLASVTAKDKLNLFFYHKQFDVIVRIVCGIDDNNPIFDFFYPDFSLRCHGIGIQPLLERSKLTHSNIRYLNQYTGIDLLYRMDGQTLNELILILAKWHQQAPVRAHDKDWSKIKKTFVYMQKLDFKKIEPVIYFDEHD
jgi:hypothetical protein